MVLKERMVAQFGDFHPDRTADIMAVQMFYV